MISFVPRRPRVVRQHEPSDCGPAALLAILRWWGGDASLVEVRDLALTDARGTTLWGLKRAAEALGFTARAVRGEYEDLTRDGTCPCILHVEPATGATHYVVCWRAAAKGARIGDPAQAGVRSVDRTEIERLWVSGAALVLRPTDRLRNAPPPSWVRWTSSYFAPRASWLVQSLVLGAAVTALGLATALCVQRLIDRFIPEGDVRMIWATGAVLGALLALRAAAGRVRRGLLLALHRDVSSRMNADFLARIFRLPLRFFERRAVGDVTVRLSELVRVQRSAIDVLGTVAVDGLVVVGSVGLLAVLAPPLGVLALAIGPLYLLVLLRATARIREKQDGAILRYSRVEASYIDGLGGITDVLAAAAAPAFVRANAARFSDLQGSLEDLGRTQSNVAALSEALGGALVLTALVGGALLTVSGDLRVGELVAGYSVIAGMLPSADRLVAAAGAYQEASVSAGRLLDVALTPPEELEAGSGPVRIAGELRLSGASIEWPPGTPVVEWVDLSVPRGRVTALMGPNGAGKTTVARALARLVPLAGGRLLVDGRPAEELRLGEYRRRVAYLSGDARIFRGSLEENVLMGREGIGLDPLAAKAEAFGLGPFLARFGGWSAPLGEGGRRLSAGERQVVGFLRAVASGPDILLADEAVAATDDRTSRLLLDALVAYAYGHGVLLVSHDPRVLARADHVYALENGRVRDEGAPWELLRDLGRPVAVARRPGSSSGDAAARRPTRTSVLS